MENIQYFKSSDIFSDTEMLRPIGVMNRQIIYILLLLLGMISCHNENNSDHYRTWEICDGVFVEQYTTFGMGAGGGSMLGDCLTDSINFRVFVGTFDEAYEGVQYYCQGDSLRVKYHSGDIKYGKLQEDSVNYYSLSSLKLVRCYSDDSFFRFKDLEKLTTIKAKLH